MFGLREWSSSCRFLTRRLQRMQDRMHLILEPRTMPHDLVAPCRRPSLAFGPGVRRPDLRQVAGRLQTGERAGINLVRLYSASLSANESDPAMPFRHQSICTVCSQAMTAYVSGESRRRPARLCSRAFVGRGRHNSRRFKWRCRSRDADMASKISAPAPESSP
jgi:hypothetical protein